MLVPVSGMFLFHELCDQDGPNTTNPIALEALIVTLDHLDEIVMRIAHGTWTKSQDALPS